MRVLISMREALSDARILGGALVGDLAWLERFVAGLRRRAAR